MVLFFSLQIYVELEVRYTPLEGTAGSWRGYDFLKVEDKNE